MARRLVRLETLVPGESSRTMVRLFDERYLTDHGTICRAFSLDPVRTKVELSDAWRGVGSQRGDGHRANTVPDGMVFFHDGTDYKPFGKLSLPFPSEKIRDVDPVDPSDFYRLNWL